MAIVHFELLLQKGVGHTRGRETSQRANSGVPSGPGTYTPSRKSTYAGARAFVETGPGLFALIEASTRPIGEDGVRSRVHLLAAP